MSTTEYRLPINELFDILDINSIEYEQPMQSQHNVKIKSPNGFVDINQFVKKHHTSAKYFLEDGNTISCSVNHLVFEHGIPTIISECNSVDTINGSTLIIGTELLGENDVYDVALDFPHQYITPNGVIHHNTTLAKVLINEIGIEEYDVLEINASRENNVDTVRDKIVNFVQMIPFGPFKVVLLDECLDENTLVTILRNGKEQHIKIKELNDTNDLVKSFNVEKNRVEWKPFKLFDKGMQETLEIEFENGEVVVCTPDHKWYVSDNFGGSIVVKASELEKYGHILTHSPM